jgi:hypothetical protein
MFIAFKLTYTEAMRTPGYDRDNKPKIKTLKSWSDIFCLATIVMFIIFLVNATNYVLSIKL